MIGAGVVQATIGLEVAQQRLEKIAKPITAEDDEQQAQANAEAPPHPEGRRRRYGLGPSASRASWSQRPVYSTREASDTSLDREVDAIVDALQAGGGPQRREDLGRLVGARYWGPGRYPQALRVAVAEGRIRRAGRSRFEPAQRREGR